MGRGRLKRIIKFTVATSGVAFGVVSLMAIKKKPSSVYQDEEKQRNPFQGKRVVFVKDENDAENADGVRGHLEAVGKCVCKPSFYEGYVKRGLDLLVSFGGMLVLSPVMGAIALAIKIEDPGPALFTQKRVGKNKEFFKLHKFRSMKMSTPHDIPTHMLDNPDQYITKVGKFLRAHSLDELPQLWDIFIGNMSLIGPRPGLWNQDLLTAERDKYDANIAKPGLTGWAQINGRDQLEIPEKAKLDGEYCKNMGLKMDLKVFFKSLHVFSRDESLVEGGTGEINKHKTEGDIPEDILVSVIIATYKRETSLGRALQSLTKQTYRNFEVIVVDDNADVAWSAKVKQIVEQYDKQLKIIYSKNETNMGSAASRNRGIGMARGQYITFLDDDDLYLPQKLEKQLRDMVLAGADYGITDLNLYNEKDQLIDRRVRSYIKEYDTSQLMKYHLLYHMTGTDTFMFRAKYLGQIGGFPGIDVGDEFYLMERAILGKGKFCYSRDCQIKAYVHGGEEGLSSGESKIQGENALLEEKKKYFSYLTKKERKYVLMRHYAVIAFAEIRRRDLGAFLSNGCKAFVTWPVACMGMLLHHR